MLKERTIRRIEKHPIRVPFLRLWREMNGGAGAPKAGGPWHGGGAVPKNQFDDLLLSHCGANPVEPVLCRMVKRVADQGTYTYEDTEPFACTAPDGSMQFQFGQQWQILPPFGFETDVVAFSLDFGGQLPFEFDIIDRPDETIYVASLALHGEQGAWRLVGTVYAFDHAQDTLVAHAIH